jgi:hypothetical protein
MQTAQVFEFPVSVYVPLGIVLRPGAGYLIFGPQELLDFPARDERVDLANGWWGSVDAGLLPVGLTWFHSFDGAPLYAAGVLTTVFGIHWFALGLIRMGRGDPRPSGFMSIAFFPVSMQTTGRSACCSSG